MSTGNQSDSDVTPSRKKADKSQGMAKKARATSWQKAAPFAVLSLVTFVIGMGVLAVILCNRNQWAGFGPLGNLLYYIVLLTLGAASAAFLFGVFRSYAQYSGKVLGGTLELGGPVVVFALVVVGGFYLLNRAPGDLKAASGEFMVTVLVCGESGRRDMPKTGKVVMLQEPQLSSSRTFGDSGRVTFEHVAAKYRAQKVSFRVDASGFEMTTPNAPYVLSEEFVNLSVRRRPECLAGRVQDTNGDPVPKATLCIDGQAIDVAPDGTFNYLFLSSSSGVHAETSAHGYEPRLDKLLPKSNDTTIVLHKKPLLHGATKP
jgi:hypothetical protein